MRCVLPILALILVSAFSLAQDNASSQPTASISGTVLDAVTRQPVKSVDVRVRHLSAGQPGGRRFGSAASDADGHFTIDGLTEGRYFIFAGHEGYVGQRISGAGPSGRLITLGPGQHVTDLLVEMTPGATISGQVKNAEAKPLQGVSVEVLRYFQGESGKQLNGVTAPVFTDVDGAYHITGLASGSYYLQAIAPAKLNATKAATRNSAPPKTAFAPTYFSNVTDLASATTLSVHPGADLAGMDFTLTPLHAVSVSGKILIVGQAPPASGTIQVTLISDGSAQHEISADAKGNYSLEGITAGDYTLVARIEPTSAKSKMFWGQRSLHVGNTNVRNADLRIGTGVQLNGHIHCDDKGVDFSHMTVSLSATGNSAVTALMPSVDNANVAPDGSFTFNDVPEGTHLLDLTPLPPGHFVRSTSTPDVLEVGIAISNSQSASTLDLTLPPDAQLTGSVVTEQMPAPSASVILIPLGSRSNQSRYSRRAVTDQSGRFSLRGIVPGDYRVLAFQAVDRSELFDPEFIQRFADRGESLHFREGDSLTVSLDAIPADESTP